jgi:hypothetical protein
MTDKIDDGGAAFPVPDVFRPDGHHAMAGWYGMSLRDWFAGQALVAMGMWIPDGDHRRGEMVASRAAFAYLQADAMLAERKRRDDK